QEGGLIDMNELEERAASENLRTVTGITKMHEALMVASAAFVWGAMPYSEAVNPTEFPHPHYDSQSDIHDAILQLIDEAIADLNAGQSSFDGSFDFAYGGDKDKWIRTAHTLKARILLNWAEVRPGNYALALQEAQQGISTTDDNWQAYHSTTAGEENILWQFQNERVGYIAVAKHIVDMLKADNDPRLQFYIGLDSRGEYSGSAHGEMNEDVSWLNESTVGGSGWDYDMVTWEENQFIIAECQYNAGDESAALATLNATLAGIENRWASYLGGASLPRYSGLTGVALLEAIMNEKYKALFLNPQIWNDWKRTGFPVLTTINNLPIPRRYLYPDDEKNTNNNFPGFLGLYHRNENDSNDPSYLSNVP
ncbi:MAG: SusD/RagB family nutrient-binding outer membrane lipoprotein, partial [bacterium]